MTRLSSVLAAGLIFCLYLTEAGAPAQAEGDAQPDLRPDVRPEIRFDTPSGLPVPRLVSLKAETTFCRSGPSFDHPVRLTFMRQGLPVMIVAETTDHWRKIRDSEGDECWTHKSKLSGAETALVLEDGLALRARPDARAPAKALLGRGVIAQVDGARGGWLRISTDGLKGWARADAFWGARAGAPVDQAIAAAHN